MYKLPYDKKLHFSAGLGIALLVGILFGPILGLQIGIIIGIVKEIYDWHDYGLFDIYDMISTWAGSLVGYGLVYILHII